MFIFLLILLILDSLILVGVVLLQAGQGGGLASMGGGASTDTFLGGRQAVTILTKMSWWCGGIFLALSLVLAGLSARGTRLKSVLEGQIQAPAPVSPLPLNVQPATPSTTPPNAQAPAPSTTTPPKKPAGPN